jgi:hypothetical protein
MTKAEDMISGVDFKAHAKKVAAILGKYYPTLLEQAYSDVGGKLPVAVSYDLHNPRVQDTIKSLALRVKGISDTTRDDIRGVVGRALDEPKIPSVQEIGKRLREAGVTSSVSRGETIARTESAYAYNHGAISAYDDAGVEKVECLDSDADPECAARNGQIMTLDEALAIDPHPNCVLAFAPVV